MRLKRLELLGFKSFADRTVMDFGDKTLTGIVGPNGCGKSNVVDACRWVLGESRPTSLRGSGMTDVIFKGSASRPAMSVAEVTLVLENDGRVEERGAEISVTRRLFKDGQGEYLIDGDKVRRKDLRDMLFDTGLGSRGYSVLEQGRIDAVLSANPQQRRAIFEEAAGVSRYRQQRHEAELRLKRADQDQVRLEDVMGELRTRVRSLKIQAGKAERWVAARDEWTTERRRLLAHRLHEHQGRLDELEPMMVQVEADLEELRSQRERSDEEAQAGEERRAELVAQLDRLSRESGKLSGEERALQERKSQLELRVAGWVASSKEERERAEQLGQEIAGEREALEELEQERSQQRDAVQEAEVQAGGLTGQLKELGKGYQAVRQEVQALNDAVLACLHEKTAAQNRVRHLEESKPAAQERLERVTARLDEQAGSVAAVREEQEEREMALEQAQASLVASETQRDETTKALDEAEGAWESARAEQGKLALERAKLTSRIESLLDRESELADLGAGTRLVFEHAGRPDGPCEKERLLGIVADHLRTDTAHARALDAVLGERAGAVVAAEADTARAVIGWLTQREEGQAAVVVPGAFGSAPPRVPELDGPARVAEFGSDLAESGAVFGRLFDFVRCDDAARGLATAMVGDVVLVRDLDAALQLIATHPNWRFVTLAGELVDSAGIVGGHRTLTQGAVGRRASAEEIEGEVRSLDARLEELEQEMQRRDSERDRLRSVLAAARAEVEERRASEAAAQGDLRAAQARVRDLEASLQLLEQERGKVGQELELLEADLERAQAASIEAMEGFEQENMRLEEAETRRRAMEEQRERIAKDANVAEVTRTRLAGELDGLTHRIEALQRRVREGESEIQRATNRADSFDKNTQEGQEEMEALAESAAEVGEQREKLESELEALREAEKEGRATLERVRAGAEEVRQRLDAASEAIGKARLEEQRLRIALEEVLARAEEELSLERQDLEQGFEVDPELEDPKALAALDKHVSQLKGQLDKLGPVNMDALSELEEVGGRLDFLEAQSADLAKSKQTLLETIKKIDQESQRLFLETFHTVRGNFQRIFRQLFGGGKADVKLEDEENVLESGVEIVARPPGRELLSINLLSGGQRTMTALALLFAVFEAKPSPFCVLDEVDAALDDANVDRFLGMLEDFRKHSQFIVVTHNKATMAATQALYGVTMETKGVSRFVNVELSEVDAFAPDAVAPAAAAEKDVEIKPAPKGKRGKKKADEAPALESAVDPAGETVAEAEAPVEVAEGTPG